MARMYLDDFEKYVEPQVLQRGKKYYQKGAVSQLQQEEADKTSYYYAEVEGSGDDYEVDITITTDGKVKEASCDCPYSYAGPCKHIVAVLLKIRNLRAEESAAMVTAPVSTEELRSAYNALAQAEKRLVMILVLSWQTLS
ncbi:MAG: SWIM zinc finger family protein, partial [Phaeodactylibacter sp.]|nr:SWIM zinc finger family protein [Phaeodactylibacter sp.]